MYRSTEFLDKYLSSVHEVKKKINLTSRTTRVCITLNKTPYIYYFSIW